MEIEAKTFIVTGGSRGIGRALVEMLVRSGARCAISGRRKKALAEALGALRALARKPDDVLAVAGDVGRDEDARKLAGAALSAFAKVDVLVNNAAILAPLADVTSTPPEVWEEVLRVNVIGTANMIRHVLPAMEERGEGVIVNLSSGWGRHAEGRVASYCASKFAVEALTQSVSDESRKGVVIFALNPGVIATDMLAEAFGGDVSAYPGPESLAPRWRALFRKVGPSWHGTSRDL